MEFTEEAKVAIEDYIRKVIGRTSLSGEDRTEVEKELRSGYYDIAGSAAKARGGTQVTIADVSRMLAGEGSPDQIAACYMKSYAGQPATGQGYCREAIAYIIDSLLIGAGILPAHGAHGALSSG